MKKVLVIATSRKTRGGITSVVKAHETGEQWDKFHCKWIETHRDGSNIRKIYYFIKAYITYIFLLPFYDIVHIHVASYSSLRRKKYFLKIAKLLNKKTIAHFHPHKPEVIFEKSTQSEYIKFFKSVDKIIVLSPQWQRWLKEALNIEKNVLVIYNPCPVIEPGKADYSKKYILFAGTLYKRKGFDTLLKAFARIASKYPEWHVVLAGNPKSEKDKIIIKTLPKQLNIEKQVEFPGWINGNKKDLLFRNASIFCLASSAEGFPMAVLDAWAYGIPVVCTPAGGLPDIVENGKNALLFNYEDDITLAQQLDKLISDENLRNNISKESLKLAQTTFNIDNINKQIEELYKSLSNE
ncbi:glycosyltransferase family 4 protein [uncultured Bacteroides sp.]|uniref:glycosyltransferase family 4 protein n=1 Tax=uncultured Bacteroides sp. TaxID=162156 RepID=UPI0025FBF317|nr:glycosyltransferase family 4 protein [uncultured Bacteroides sp.]